MSYHVLTIGELIMRHDPKACSFIASNPNEVGIWTDECGSVVAQHLDFSEPVLDTGEKVV